MKGFFKWGLAERRHSQEQPLTGGNTAPCDDALASVYVFFQRTDIFDEYRGAAQLTERMKEN